MLYRWLISGLILALSAINSMRCVRERERGSGQKDIRKQEQEEEEKDTGKTYWCLCGVRMCMRARVSVRVRMCMRACVRV